MQFSNVRGTLPRAPWWEQDHVIYRTHQEDKTKFFLSSGGTIFQCWHKNMTIPYVHTEDNCMSISAKFSCDLPFRSCLYAFPHTLRFCVVRIPTGVEGCVERSTTFLSWWISWRTFRGFPSLSYTSILKNWNIGSYCNNTEKINSYLVIIVYIPTF